MSSKFELQSYLDKVYSRYPEAEYQPVIGITGNFEDITCKLSQGYYQSVVAAGGVPMIIPPVEDANTLFETSTALYDAMNKNSRINYFWQLASAAMIEEIYVISQNSDKFLSVFDDEAADKISFRTFLIHDAVNRLAQYDPDMKPVAEALAPLEVFNATTVDELKAQIASAKEQIANARQNLIK